LDYRIFLDTANVKEIEEALETGIVDGIATNPNKMAQVGRKYEDVIRDIRSIFDGPVAVEAISTKAEDIIEEAQRLSSMASRMVGSFFIELSPFLPVECGVFSAPAANALWRSARKCRAR